MKEQELFETAKNMIIQDCVTKLKKIGYKNADENNLFTDAIYSQIFKNMLQGYKGQDNRIDDIVDDILIDLFSKQIN